MMAIFGVAEKLPKEPEPKDMQRLMEKHERKKRLKPSYRS